MFQTQHNSHEAMIDDKEDGEPIVVILLALILYTLS